MVRTKKPTIMGKMLNFLTGTPKAHKPRDSEEEKRRHARKTADHHSRKEVENQQIRRTRPNPEKQAAHDEALRKLNGQPEPARRQPPPVRTDNPRPTERTRPEPAHTRRQRVRTDDRDGPEHRRNRSDHRQRDPRSRPQPELQRRHEAPAVPKYIAPSFGSSVDSSHMQSLDSRGGEPHKIKGPNRKPDITYKIPDTVNPVKVADVISRTSSRRNDRPARGSDRTTQFGDFLRPVSPLLPPPPPVVSLSSLSNAGKSQQGREASGRDKSIPLCQMCQTQRSNMDGCYSVLGYHLCANCKQKAFSEDGPQDLGSPVSPLTPEQTSEARFQQFDFANTARRGQATRASSRSNDTTKSKSRNLTGHGAQTPARTPTSHQRAPSSGLNPALHKSASKTSRRQPTYSTIFNDRAQAQPAPSLPALPPHHQKDLPSIPALPLRHKTSSVYSLTDTLPPSMLPPTSIPPPTSTKPHPRLPVPIPSSPARRKDAISKPAPKKPTTTSHRLSRPFEEPPHPQPRSDRKTPHRLSRPFQEPANPRPSGTPAALLYKSSASAKNKKVGHAHLRISPPASPGTSAWTEDWSGYGASTVAEAKAVPEGGEKEGDGERRDTRFYGHWDSILGDGKAEGSEGGRGRKRYNGL